jgi:hypothetical protein
MAGYVYLIGSSVFKWYKIGKSRTPQVRISTLGVLLPFKIKVYAVWKAKDHTALEAELHQKYAYCRVNGEWFSFDNGEVESLFRLIPEAARVYPTGDLRSVFAAFSNIDTDERGGKRVIGVRVQKLRGNFTPEEREIKRQEAIKNQREKKLQRLSCLSSIK